MRLSTGATIISSSASCKRVQGYNEASGQVFDTQKNFNIDPNHDVFLGYELAAGSKVDPSKWLELYNNGGADVDLTGWALSPYTFLPTYWVLLLTLPSLILIIVCFRLSLRVQSFALAVTSWS